MNSQKCKTILIFVILFALCQIVSGQKKVIEEAELDALIYKAEKLREGKSFRKDTQIERFELNNLMLKFKSIQVSEVLPPDRSYSSSFFKSGDEKEKNEFITVGDKGFGRKDGGEWMEVKVSKDKNNSEDANAYSEIKTKVVYLGETKIGKKRVNLYEKVRHEVLFPDEKQVRTFKYWFDKNGYLLKESLKIEFLKRSEIYTKISIYDYDANINIEIPLVKTK